MPNTQACAIFPLHQIHNVSKLTPNHSPIGHDKEAGAVAAKHPGARPAALPSTGFKTALNSNSFKTTHP